MQISEKILIIDFGSQFTQLITRRIREANVFSEIYPHTITLEQIKEINPRGIILSGGPMSVYDDGAPLIDIDVLKLGIPVLGICYGLQFICQALGGAVESASDREYGKAALKIQEYDDLFKGVQDNSTVWMSHGDYLTRLPEGFKVTADSAHSPICAVSNKSKKIYGVQFHPEVMHTAEGQKILSNFLFGICGCSGNWTSKNFLIEKTNEIKAKAGNSKVICALSGGVDSTVAAVLVGNAIGNNLTCIHIDTGLMRKNESRFIKEMFDSRLKLNVIHINAADIFLKDLKVLLILRRKEK